MAAGVEANAKKQNRKRKKTINNAQPQKPPKLHRFDDSAHKPQNNLELILFIQNNHIDLQSKVNQVFHFMHSRVDDGVVDTDHQSETKKLPRLLFSYLNDWILKVLFPPIENENWRDIRYWEIFKFCLEETLKFHVSLKMSRKLLQTIQFIARNALCDSSICSGQHFIPDERLKLYDTVLDCVSYVFSSHGGLSNQNLDLWVEAAGAALELVLQLYGNNLVGRSHVGDFALHFLWLVLHSFSKFLMVHPTKKVFRNFVDKLLEPLLHLSGELHLQDNGSVPVWTGKLIEAVDEVLSHGLFHPGHDDELLSLHGSERYVASCDDNPKATIKSYHRYLFGELNSIIARKNTKAMGSLGLIFHLFVDSTRKFKGTSVLDEGSKTTEKLNGLRQPMPEENCSPKKSPFNFLVLIMEPLLRECNTYLGTKINPKLLFSDICGILKSIGNLLASCMQEKVYVKTEDTSGGGLKFLKKVFNTLITCSTSLHCLSNTETANEMGMETFILLANELLVAIGYLLDIEYKVIGEDLVNLWLILLSYSAINCSLLNSSDQCSLSSVVPSLGCQIINLYTQLRQVNVAILALSKAIRLVTSHDGNAEESSSWFLTFLSNYPESIERLLSSDKFIHAICRSIESIPEGQVSGCIRQITDDISETLSWMTDSPPLVGGKKSQMFNLQVEFLGRGLSRLYCLVLDSVTITEGNSRLLGVAVKKLMALLRPYLSMLVQQQPDTICKFFSFFTSGAIGRSSQWIFVFFFQLFVSCRNSLRQAIRLMPPSLSKKMAAKVGDYTAYSAFELMERIDEIDNGFFSWVVQPSASLLVVMQLISDVNLKYGSDDSPQLVYVFQSLALQRLVDLNRQIIMLKYLQKERYRSQIKALKEEAARLSNFIMENLSCVYQSPLFVSDDVTHGNVVSLAPQSNGRNQGIYFGSENLLPTAIWSNICKHVDVWVNHVSKKQLKKFLSHLLRTSLHCVSSSFQDPGMEDECKLLKRVTLPHISSDILNDSLLYEQKFAHRNLAKIFCSVFEKHVLLLFSDIACTAENLRSLPNWDEFSKVLHNSSIVVGENKEVPDDCSAVEKTVGRSCDKVPEYISSKEKTSPLTIKSFTDCHHLLNLLCLMPDINASSSSLIVTCIFNLERLLVRVLLNFQSTLYQSNYCEYLRLFVSCRRGLRYILMGFSEKEDTIQSAPISVISESSFPILWLSKSLSVIVGIPEALLGESAVPFKSLMFSLIDHTSYALLGIGKYSSSQYVDPPKLEALKCLNFMAENLKERMQNLFVFQKDTPCVSAGFGLAYKHINRLSSAVSCISGVLWGLTYATGQKEAKYSDDKEKVLTWKSEHASELNSCIQSLVEVVDFFANKLLNENSQPTKNLHDTQRFEKPSLSSTEYLSPECSVSKANGSSGTRKKSKTAATFSTSAIDNVSESASVVERLSSPENINYVARALAWDDSPELQDLNKPLLQRLVKGDHPEDAFLLRQLLIALSSLLRLNLQKDDSSLPSSSVLAFIEISKFLLLEFTEMVVVPQSAFLLFDGALSFLKELASYFAYTDPTSSRKVYTELVQVQIRAIGKTILLQGKRATLYFHERQSSTKTLHKGSFEACSSNVLDEFKTRLRVSFKAYIERQPEVHLLSTIQAIEKALVGVQEGCSVIYDIKTSKDGGEISSIVAAGIDCFDMIIEFVSGRKSLKLIKRHCQSLVGAIFNIIVHLQSPQIFRANLTSRTDTSNPDPGSAILMCVEVLVTISRKHSLFPMDVWHVGHLLHIPAVLFRSFPQLRISKASGPSDSFFISEVPNSHPTESVNFCHVDHQFSINLYVACCQLLCTIIRHRPSECKQCVGHLEASVTALLNCLETVLDNKSKVNEGYFSWEVEEGVKCACFLRRIYEEIKQQKDIFGRQCSLFLSNYIRVYSEYGPKRSGIKREIDEALRPGVYALIDACSVDDLQYLHTFFWRGALQK